MIMGLDFDLIFFFVGFQNCSHVFYLYFFHFTVAKGDEYHAFRGTARQHWDSVKSYYQKVRWF